MKIAVVALLVGVLTLSLLSPLALGHSPSEGEGMEDEFESATRRVEIDEMEGEVEVRSVGADGDRIRMRLRADEAELRFDFLTAETNLTEVQLELEFEAVLEYMDENGNGRFDKGETVLQEFRVRDMAFSGPVIEQVSDGSRIEVTYEASGFTLGLVFWVFGNETLVNGTLVRPTEVKFDIHVTDYPFQEEDSNLAVVFDLKTEVEPEMNSEATLESLEAISGQYEGFFRWSTTAEVDGEVVDVNSTVIEVETEVNGEFEVERTIALSYPQGSAIVHDPWIGVARAPPASGMDPLVLTGVLAAVIAGSVGIAVLLARRRGEA
jgi:hypothetical protein